MDKCYRAGSKTYYVDSPTRVGIYLSGPESACLIDSGNDKEAAKRLLAILGSWGRQLETIINTHSNADHIGGNAYLQQQTNCTIITSDIERAFVMHPVLEPSFLYGGYPMKALRNKFLCAQPSVPLFEGAEGCLGLPSLPVGLEAIPLEGHFYRMFGVRTDDSVCFIADSLFSKTILMKYHVVFIYDVAGFLRTLDTLLRLDASLFVPSHAEVSEDISELVSANRAKVEEVTQLLLHLCSEGVTVDEIIKLVFDYYALKLDINQYVLVGSTLKSYLSYLVDSGRVRCDFSKNSLKWVTVR